MAGISVVPMDLGKDAGTGLAGPPRMVGTVLQDNFVAETRFGYATSTRAASTLLYKNYIQWVPTPLVDRGVRTQNLDLTVRSDEEYTPERGPIR